MLTLCLAIPAIALAQSTPFPGERTEIVRAVLKAERERQAREFESVSKLSTESIAALSPAQLAQDFQFNLLTPEEIKQRAKSFVGVDYLAFKDFHIETGRAVVRVLVAREVTPCFAPYQKQQKYLTFLLVKKDGKWQAERVWHPRANPYFDLKMSGPDFTPKDSRIPFLSF